MIARVWHCTAAADKTADYLAYFQRAVLPELNQIDGYKGVYILRRALGDDVELTVQTFWETEVAVRRFAGQKIENAVITPEAQALLLRFDTTVTHYEIALHLGGFE